VNFTSRLVKTKHTKKHAKLHHAAEVFVPLAIPFSF
jgi:hypothetical protein